MPRYALLSRISSNVLLESEHHTVFPQPLNIIENMASLFGCLLILPMFLQMGGDKQQVLLRAGQTFTPTSNLYLKHFNNYNFNKCYREQYPLRALSYSNAGSAHDIHKALQPLARASKESNIWKGCPFLCRVMTSSHPCKRIKLTMYLLVCESKRQQ